MPYAHKRYIYILSHIICTNIKNSFFANFRAKKEVIWMKQKAVEAEFFRIFSAATQRACKAKPLDKLVHEIMPKKSQMHA